MKNEKLTLMAGIMVLVAVLAFFAFQQTTPAQASFQQPLKNSIMLTPDEVQFKPGPASLPPGSEFALIEGNTMMVEPFEFRIKLPADYTLAPHRHSSIEHVTVISGSLYFGEGTEFDEAKAELFPAGSVMIMPIGAPMFGFTREETVIQVHGVGPWSIEYINPSDDPRKK